MDELRMTKKQKKRENTAKMIESCVGKNETSERLREINRKVDLKKGKILPKITKNN